MLTSTATIHAWRGELAAAAAVAEDVLEAARLTRADQLMVWARSLGCWVAMLRGDVADAVRFGEEAYGIAQRLGRDQVNLLATCRLGEACLEAGDADRCVELIVGATGGPGLEPIDPPFRSHLYEVLTRAELRRGDLTAAQRWTARAEDVLVGVEIHGRHAEGRRARAAVELASGNARGALDAALTAVEHAERGDVGIDAARGRILAGRALVAAGARRDAVAQFEAARDALAGYGARRWEDEAARELRRLGRPAARPGRRRGGGPRTGIAALTPRERQVTELVAAGRTNRQIAGELFLSEKTVEGYLANVFAKLEVTGRAAVAAAAARGLENPGSPG